MKKIVATFICLSSFASFAGEELRSDKLRGLVCSSTLSDVEDITAYENMNLSSKDCIKNAKITLESSVFNAVINQAVSLRTSLKYEVGSLSISSDVELKKIINFSDSGEIISRWNAHDIQLDVEDSRSLEAMLEDLYSSDDWDVVNIGNGDWGLYSPSKPVTMADIEEDFDEIQSDTSCNFYADYDLENILSEVDEYSYKVSALLEEHKDEILHAGYLAYDEGESEYCSLWYFQIVLKSGKVLYLNIDATT